MHNWCRIMTMARPPMHIAYPRQRWMDRGTARERGRAQTAQQFDWNLFLRRVEWCQKYWRHEIDNRLCCCRFTWTKTIPHRVVAVPCSMSMRAKRLFAVSGFTISESTFTANIKSRLTAIKCMKTNESCKMAPRYWCLIQYDRHAEKRDQWIEIMSPATKRRYEFRKRLTWAMNARTMSSK